MQTVTHSHLEHNHIPPAGPAKKTLTDKLGGPDAIKATVHALYSRLTKDHVTKIFFQDADLAALSVHLYFFLKHVTDGRATPEDRLDLIVRHHHQRLFHKGLNEQHFDRLVEHLVITLKGFKISRDTMDELIAAVGPLRSAFAQGVFPSERLDI